MIFLNDAHGLSLHLVKKEMCDAIFMICVYVLEQSRDAYATNFYQREPYHVVCGQVLSGEVQTLFKVPIHNLRKGGRVAWQLTEEEQCIQKNHCDSNAKVWMHSAHSKTAKTAQDNSNLHGECSFAVKDVVMVRMAHHNSVSTISDEQVWI